MVRKGGTELLIVDASGRVAVSTDSARVDINMATDSAVVNTLKSRTPEHNEDIHRQVDGSLVMDFGHVPHRDQSQLVRKLRLVSGHRHTPTLDGPRGTGVDPVSGDE